MIALDGGVGGGGGDAALEIRATASICFSDESLNTFHE